MNRRLRQAHDAGDGLRVAPALEIVMIGTHEVREAGRLVDPLGGAHEERHALGDHWPARRVRQVVTGFAPATIRRLNFAAREFGPQLRESRSLP